MDSCEDSEESAPLAITPGSAPSYGIRTLQDIWNLPSYEHMERCFFDIQRAMLQARSTNDMFVGLAQADGKKVTQAFMWPETMQWIDDGKKEIHATYLGHAGIPWMKMSTTKPDKPNTKVCHGAPEPKLKT